ncbi:MAG: hypothetical protein AAGA35_03325 [Patescibacteria group bacterium]
MKHLTKTLLLATVSFPQLLQAKPHNSHDLPSGYQSINCTGEGDWHHVPWNETDPKDGATKEFVRVSCTEKNRFCILVVFPELVAVSFKRIDIGVIGTNQTVVAQAFLYIDQENNILSKEALQSEAYDVALQHCSWPKEIEIMRARPS